MVTVPPLRVVAVFCVIDAWEPVVLWIVASAFGASAVLIAVVPVAEVGFVTASSLVMFQQVVIENVDRAVSTNVMARSFATVHPAAPLLIVRIFDTCQQ